MKHWLFITRAIDSAKYILNIQLSPAGRTSLLKTFWSELKFLRTFNNNILGVINGKVQVTKSQNFAIVLLLGKDGGSCRQSKAT